MYSSGLQIMEKDNKIIEVVSLLSCLIVLRAVVGASRHSRVFGAFDDVGVNFNQISCL